MAPRSCVNVGDDKSDGGRCQREAQQVGEQLTVDMDYCKGCGICAHECPKKCIEMVKEAE